VLTIGNRQMLEEAGAEASAGVGPQDVASGPALGFTPALHDELRENSTREAGAIEDTPGGGNGAGSRTMVKEAVRAVGQSHRHLTAVPSPAWSAAARLRVAAGELADRGRTVIHVAVDGRPAAVLGVADTPRPTSRAAVRELRRLGIHVVMLSGDSAATATHIARELGIEEVRAEVLPAEKAAEVRRLQSQGRRVVMVGDGVNDAPALATADAGVAIGAGTDVAVEAAGAVLVRSDPLDVVTAVLIGRGTYRKMRQNLAWAVGYNALALPVAAGALASIGIVLRPEAAAILMSGSSVLVAVNALLLMQLTLPERVSRRAVRGMPGALPAEVPPVGSAAALAAAPPTAVPAPDEELGDRPHRDRDEDDRLVPPAA
jgi:cation transport ATPase